MNLFSGIKYGIYGAISVPTLMIIYNCNKKQKNNLYTHPIIDGMEYIKDGLFGFWSGITIYMVYSFLHYSKNYLKHIGSSQ